MSKNSFSFEDGWHEGTKKAISFCVENHLGHLKSILSTEIYDHIIKKTKEILYQDFYYGGLSVVVNNDEVGYIIKKKDFIFEFEDYSLEKVINKLDERISKLEQLLQPESPKTIKPCVYCGSVEIESKPDRR